MLEIYNKKRSTKPSVQFGSLNTSSANNISQSNNNVKSDILPKYSMQENKNNTSENIETLINNHEFYSNEIKNMVEDIKQCNNQNKKDITSWPGHKVYYH